MRSGLLLALLLLLLTACGGARTEGPVEIAIIGERDSLFESGLRLSAAAQHLRAATDEGLVSLDPTGQIVPGVAERWIVTDDGLSYIFRLRNTDWPGGEAITAAQVRAILMENRARLRGTSLGLDLAKIEDIRAMTGRVVEIRLTSPMPDFLRVLAQPEMGLVHDGEGAGPMVLEREAALAILRAQPPEARGLPSRENWEEAARPLRVRALPARAAVDAFNAGEVDLVLNGRLSSLPLPSTGPLSRGTIRIDGAVGLFGLVVRRETGVLSEASLREALAMAIDRDTLMEPFGLGGWQATTRIVPAELTADPAAATERWAGASLDERRAQARRRIATWRIATGGDPTVTIGLPSGPGSQILFNRLATDLQSVGVRAVPMEAGEGADLELHDRTARFAGARWFLNQFHCSLKLGLCSPEADALVRDAIAPDNMAQEAALLDEAEQAMLAANVFIPLGSPIRWSLVRGNIAGFVENPWGLHPLFPLSQPPT